MEKWRARFVELGVDGLLDEPRPGAPRSISDADVERVVTRTLETTPEDATHWSTRSMAKASGLSQSAVSRIWRAFALQPPRTETFKLSKGPLFIEKVRDIVGLYLNSSTRALVLCVAEKSEIQALDGTQPLLPMRPGRSSGVPTIMCATAPPHLERWWRPEGEVRYPDATELFILADGGGSNGHRVWAFEYWLQHHLCDRHCLVVTVAHYPAGTSKWNPLEHRLFSETSKCWAGRPLDSLETLLAKATSTRTAAGLEVTAQRVEGLFQTGKNISKAQMKTLDLEPHQVQPNRNYALYPRLFLTHPPTRSYSCVGPYRL